MIKVVVDANVYISAIAFGGKPARVLDLARQKKIRIIISESLTEQISKVLRLKFNWGNWLVYDVLLDIKELADLVMPRKILKVIKEKENDNRILECAVEGKADYIISGDKKHILPLKEFKDIKIVNPNEFLKIFDKKIKLG